VPPREEAAESRLVGGLDLAPQRREGRAPDPPEDVGVAPLALDAARSELAADELVARLEPREKRLGVGRLEWPPGSVKVTVKSAEVFSAPCTP